MYTLQSTVDKGKFEVDEIVMKSSTLLKNLCEMTLITEPVKVPCSSQCLEWFIQIVKKKDKFFSDIIDQRLIKICKEMSILDSDIVLNSIAEEILYRIRKLNWDKMIKYFGLEDDFSVDERKFIGDRNRVEYIISMDTEYMKFPLLGTKFSSMKNKFYTPLNALLARVVQLSQGKTAFELSKINKAMKNESDRYPIKIYMFTVGKTWKLNVGNTFIFNNQKYFEQIKKRKLIVEAEVSFSSNSKSSSNLCAYQCSSLNFVIPRKLTRHEIEFQGDVRAIYSFNVKEFPFPSVQYRFIMISINFDKVYEHLVAKDVTKEINIFSSCAFDFFFGESLHIYKKPDASQFHEIRIQSSPKRIPSSSFTNFVMKYMSDDGVIYAKDEIFEIPHLINNNDIYDCDRYIYSATDVKQFLQKIKTT